MPSTIVSTITLTLYPKDRKTVGDLESRFADQLNVFKNAWDFLLTEIDPHAFFFIDLSRPRIPFLVRTGEVSVRPFVTNDNYKMFANQALHELVSLLNNGGFKAKIANW